MNLLYEALPDSVAVNGSAYPIYTDFRDWLRFFDLQEDTNISQKEKLRLMLAWYKEQPPPECLKESIEALISFAVRGKQLSDTGTPGQKSTDRVLSWSYDAAYIYAAFLSVYRIDLLSIPYLHFHAFMGLLDGLPEDTPLKQRMGYRAVNLSAIKDKNEKKRIRKIKDSIRIPQAKLDAYQVGDFFG